MNIKALIIALTLLFPTVALSSGQTPHELVDEMTSTILSAAKSSTKKNYRVNIQEIVNRDYRNKIDFRRMTMKSAGIKNFNRATSEQQKTLVEEYAEFITGTLSAAIFEHSDHAIEVQAGSAGKDTNNVEVGLTIKDRVTGKENTVGFLLHSPDGDWKIYDLNIFDTSSLKTNESYFKDKIEKSGIEGLIEDL